MYKREKPLRRNVNGRMPIYDGRWRPKLIERTNDNKKLEWT